MRKPRFSPSCEKRQITSLPEIFIKNIPGHRMIKQLLNSVIVKYRDLSYLIDLLATDKSRYFAQPRPTIIKYLLNCVNVEKFSQLINTFNVRNNFSAFF